MLPTAGTNFPDDNASVLAALAHSIAPLGVISPVFGLDGSYPSFAAIRIDLTGALFHRALHPPAAVEDAAGGFGAGVVEVHADPAYFEGLPFRLSARASDCGFVFSPAEDGTRTAKLHNASGGSAEVSVKIADIEATLLALAGEAASAHGATVQSIRVSMETKTPRRLALTATATARAMMFSATLTLRGRLEIDDAFNARLRDVACSGEGMIANLAAAQLRPRIAAWEGIPFPLAGVLPPGFAFGDVALGVDPMHGLSVRVQLEMKIAS